MFQTTNQIILICLKISLNPLVSHRKHPFKFAFCWYSVCPILRHTHIITRLSKAASPHDQERPVVLEFHRVDVGRKEVALHDFRRRSVLGSPGPWMTSRKFTRFLWIARIKKTDDLNPMGSKDSDYMNITEYCGSWVVSGKFAKNDV